MGMGTPPSARGGRRRTPMADINVTPLVDVMLVLLIIFMVTAPLLVTGVPVNLPENKAKALDQDQEPAIVSIDRDGAIFVDERQVTEDALGPALDGIRAQTPATEPPPQVFLRADKALDYGRVMTVMGELNRAGLTRVALVSTAESGRRPGISAGSERRP
jgi:biopolymer transport protein TolR